MPSIRFLTNLYEDSPTVFVEDEEGEIVDVKDMWGLTNKEGLPQLKCLFEKLGYNVIIEEEKI